MTANYALGGSYTNRRAPSGLLYHATLAHDSTQAITSHPCAHAGGRVPYTPRELAYCSDLLTWARVAGETKERAESVPRTIERKLRQILTLRSSLAREGGPLKFETAHSKDGLRTT